MQGMRSTIAVFVIAFVALGLLLGFAQSYDAEKSLALGAASKIDFVNNSAYSLCPDNPHKDAKPDVDWSGCMFYSADLSGVNLSGARLGNTMLAGSLLEGANLSGADLSGADLTIAYLSNANLSNANLSNADLSFADLSGTNLQGAKLDCRNHPVCKD